MFAGTPEPAVPSLRRLLNSSRHEVLAVISRPDAVAGRGRRVTRSPVGTTRRRGGSAGADPGAAVGTGVRFAVAGTRARLRARGRLWCADPAAGARDSPARLGEPALLAIAGLAGCRAGAGRDRRRGRGHRGERLPAGTGNGHRAGLRGRHRTDRRQGHRGRVAHPPRRIRRRAARDHPRRYRRRSAAGGSAAGRGRVVRTEGECRRRPGAVGTSGVGGREADPLRHPGTRRVDDGRRSAPEGRARSVRSSGRCLRERSRSARTACTSAPPPPRCGSTGSSRRARRRWRPWTGAASALGCPRVSSRNEHEAPGG